MSTTAKGTLDQERAKHAWEVVKKMLELFPHHPPRVPNGKREPHAHAKAFGGAARKLPVRIMASGLGQALAFLKAKGKTKELLDALGGWVLRDQKLKDLLDAVIQGTADTLRMHTAETLAYLQWLNRFCEAEKLTDDTE